MEEIIKNRYCDRCNNHIKNKPPILWKWGILSEYKIFSILLPPRTTLKQKIELCRECEKSFNKWLSNN